jgi:hypothetical protein
LGEDLFTCSFLAYKDVHLHHDRSYFSWRPVLATDNSRLKTLLSKGLAENHFHLFGSAPYCELSWISLMNNISHRLPEFRSLLKDGLLGQPDNYLAAKNYNIYFLTLKASIIRAHFFSLLIKDEPLFYDFSKQYLYKKSKKSKFNDSKDKIIKESFTFLKQLLNNPSAKTNLIF